LPTVTDSGGTIVAETADVSNATKAPIYGQITVTTSAQTLSALLAAASPSVILPPWATLVLLTPETGSIRYRADGTAPTSGVGQPVAQSTSWPVQGGFSAMQLIAASSVTVSVEIRG
jgi:hypothetical protein